MSAAKGQRVGVVYRALATSIALVAMLALALIPFRQFEWLAISPLACVLAILLSLGLHARESAHWRLLALGCGLGISVVCAIELLSFIARGSAVDIAIFGRFLNRSFASGLFCLGAALVMDVVLPARWGRHLLFGLLGALAALIGAAGLLALVIDASLAFDSMLLDGIRIPGSLILLLGGITLLWGARLREIKSGRDFETDLAERDLMDRSGFAVGLAMLLITTGATLVFWRQVQIQSQAQYEARLSASLQQFTEGVRSNVSSALNLLNGVRGLFAASEFVDANEWSRYFQQVQIVYKYDPVLMVGFAEERTGPVPGSVPQFVVTYVSPQTATSLPAIGIHASENPVIASAIADSANTGQAVLSGPVDFSVYVPGIRNRGFIALIMVETGGERSPGGSQTLDRQHGAVFFAVDAAQLASLAGRGGGEGLLVRIKDNEQPASQAALFQSKDFDASASFNSAALVVGGRKWTISTQYPPETLAAMRSRVPTMVLASGLVAALVLFVVTWTLTGLRARALHFAQGVNRNLRKSQREQQAVTDTATAGIVTANQAGTILYMNPAAARSFGVDAPEMYGKSVGLLVPERFREAFIAGLGRIASGDVVHPLDHPLELVARHSNGTEFPVEILRSMWSSDGMNYFTAIVTEISQRRQAEKELEKRARELERSNSDLEQFAYVASHDLQEPLRMVASYVQLLARRYKGRLDADADEFIGFAVDGARRMQNLIEDLLAYSRVGRSGRAPVATGIAECAERAIAQLAGTIAECGARIRIDAQHRVLATPTQLTQVLQNLMGNALKFRGDRIPEIVVSSRDDGEFVEVVVTDNGIGIEPRHWDRIFSIFQRLHTRSEYSGTGIGLAICRKVIEGFGGRIWVQSTPGSGSEFHFTLPAGGESA